MLNSLKIHTHKEFTELQTDRDNVLAKLTASENEVNNLKAMSKDMSEKQAEHDNVIATLKTAHETAINALKTDYETQLTNLRSQVEAEKQSAETKGQAIAASIGIADETKLPKLNKEDNSTAILDTFKGMSPSEMSAHFVKNQKAVFAALKAKAANKKD